MHSREQYLEEVRQEYVRADKRGRSRLLNEARRRTRLNRKYLIRILNGTKGADSQKLGRRSRSRSYGVAVLSSLVEVWEIFDYPRGQRLEPALKQEVERLRDFGELRCSDEVAEQLRHISGKTIDRLLAREKQVRGLRRNRNPGVQRLNWERVPVKVAADWDTQQVGNLQVDFVAHCGRSTGGDYIYTLSAVDMASGWWEGQAIRDAAAVYRAGKSLESGYCESFIAPLPTETRPSIHRRCPIDRVITSPSGSLCRLDFLDGRFALGLL